MLTRDHLLEVADLYRSLTGIEEETTLSHRVFGDTKKLRQLREGVGITLDRFNAAMIWFATRWPECQPMPDCLRAFSPVPLPSPTPVSEAPDSKDAA